MSFDRLCRRPCRQARKIDNGYTVAVGAGLDSIDLGLLGIG